MTQTQKKSSNHSSAKAASSANKANRIARDALESSRNSTENVVRFGSTAMKEFMATSTGEAQKAQEKALELSRENAEHFAKSADAATKMMYEMVGMSRDNLDTCVECGNLTATLAQEISSEVFENANQAFSDTVETSKEFFACRTINDMVELQNRMVQRSIDNFFTESLKLSDMFFKYTTETLEPINERVVSASEQLSKTLAA